MLQAKTIGFGFEKTKTNDLAAEILSNTIPFITSLKLPAGTGFRLGSVFDPNYPKNVNSSSGTNTMAAELGRGIRITDLNTISKLTGLNPQKINYVLGGTNLFWQKVDTVFYRNDWQGKNIPSESLWYDQPLCFFRQDTSGHFNMDILKPCSGKIDFPSDLNIAVSGRPLLLGGVKLDLYTPLTNNGLSPAEYFFLEDGRDARHLVKLPQVKDKEREKHFLGMEYFSQNPEQLAAARLGLPVIIPYKKDLFNIKNLYCGLRKCYPEHSRRWEVDEKRAEVHFPDGLDKNKYPHNVLAVDKNDNAYLMQFHGKPGQEGLTIEELQNYLLDFKMHSAIVTSNGLDVFVYDVRRNKYFSRSRGLADVLARRDRLAQHLLFVYEE
ncbi:hypothetical protein NO2_0599 [Candidatus Termititenax persephonae]|uniref:Uncharacterized protein n=1 Tax=Candidatus Termititenax persephonae TaxID=2218525 RepID=A0A388TFZ4_9BACT|nr:hypothetical protein NO2_0599 [Candidatus Termititenax persephonae]